MLNSKFCFANNILSSDVVKTPTRKGYGEALVELGQSNPNVVVLTGDLAESTTAHMFREKFPERFVECGVAEQNMMGIAAGLALSGKIPFISSYAVFSPGRSWDQLRVSVCYSQANVKIAGAHTGISVGPDGATHQALEDIAITRVLPNMTVIAPADSVETKKVTLAAASISGPVYFRFARNATPVFSTIESPFKIGRAEVLKDGKDLLLVACGPVVYNCLVAALELEGEGVSVAVINNHTIKPIDRQTISEWAFKCKKVLTVEEHQISGGMGSAVTEVLAEDCPVPVYRLGIFDHFGESGEPEELLKKFKLDSVGIMQYIKKVLKKN